MKSLLKCINVSKRYKKNRTDILALDNATLTVQRGEFVAIQGPSGGGKSTLLLIAGSLLSPDTGYVTLENDSLFSLSYKKRTTILASKIGFVFQQFHLIPYLSVLDNIQAPALAVGKRGSLRKAHDLLSKFGLEHRVKHYPSELSVGEKQRVACARALYNDPSLILADEPTGNLDENSSKIVCSFLREFVDQGGSVLMVTHDNNALKNVDKIYDMYNGKLNQRS